MRPFMLGNIRVDPAALSIERDGESVRVEAKVMQVLVALVHADCEVATRAELERAVWPGRIVTEDTVTNAVVKLRKALNDDSRRPRVIETIAKRGYRLMTRPAFEHARPSAGSPAASAAISPRRSRIGLGILVLLLVATLASLLWREGWHRHVAKPVERTPSIAVIPLETLGGGDTQRYFSEGITLDLITELSRVPGLLVISPDTAFAYRQSPVDARTVGAQTGVSYLVRGGIQRSGDRLRINIRLIETAGGRTLWAKRFDGEREQIFQIQDQVVSGITDALRKQLLLPFSAPTRDAVTRSIAAYDAFLQGLERYGRRTPADNREAQAHFEQAVELDPAFARAYAGLALTWSRQAIDGWTGAPEAALARASELAAAAAKIDPDIPQVHFVQAQVELFRGQHQRAAAAASEAIKLNPNYADAYALLAWILHYAGRPDQALPALGEALKRNPGSSASYHEIAGEIHFAARRYRQAADEFLAALARNPTHMRARLWLAATYMRLGKQGQASWEVQELLSIYPDFSLSQLPHAFPLKDPRQLATLKETLGLLRLP